MSKVIVLLSCFVVLCALGMGNLGITEAAECTSIPEPANPAGIITIDLEVYTGHCVFQEIFSGCGPLLDWIRAIDGEDDVYPCQYYGGKRLPANKCVFDECEIPEVLEAIDAAPGEELSYVLF